MISIVIPVYNRAHTIEETIESVINQESQNWELILVDDGSTDNSIEVIEEYSLKDSRVKLFYRNKMPKGAPTCRNIGVNKSKGKWLIFLDSDDLMAPYCVKQRLDSIERKDIDFAVFNTYEFKRHPTNIIGVFNNYPRQNEDFLGMFLEHHLPWQTMSAVWNKAFVKTIGGYSENLERFQDVDFHIKALRFTRNFKDFRHLPPDTYYRVGFEGLTGDKFILRQTNAVRLLLENIFSKNMPPLQKKYRKHLKRGVYRLIQRYFNNSRSHLWEENISTIIKISQTNYILKSDDFALLLIYKLAWSKRIIGMKNIGLIGFLNRVIRLKISNQKG